MSTLVPLSLVILVQISFACAASSILLMFFRRRADRRHGIAIVTLALLLAAPVFAVCLPVGWVSSVTLDNLPADSAQLTLPDSAVDSFGSQGISPATLVTSDAGSSDDTVHAEFTQIAATENSARIALKTDSGSTHVSEQSWTYIAAMLGVYGWFIGIALASVRLLRRRHQLNQIRRSLKKLQPAEIPNGILSHVQTQTGSAYQPTIMTSNVLATPAILALFRPVVVLPYDLVADSNVQQLKDVLVHECAHIVRNDHWIHALQQLAGVLYWFHPGVMWLNHTLSKAREEVCDNYVLRQSDPADYAQTLLQLTERCSDLRPALSLLGLFAPRWSLESRITDLLNPQRATQLRPERPLLIVTAVLLILSCLLTGGIADESDELKNVDEQPATAQPADPIDDIPAAPSPVDTASAENTIAESDSELRTIRLHGICEDDETEPIAGATVTVYRYPSQSAKPIKVADGITDNNGQFDFPAVPSAVNLSAYKGQSDLIVTATHDRHASSYNWLRANTMDDETTMRLSRHVGSLKGKVRDDRGVAVKGATVTTMHTSSFFTHPVRGIHTATTDAAGHYAITDIAEWKSQDTEITSETDYDYATSNTWIYFNVIHPDFALTRPRYSSIPQEVNVTLHSPAIVEGQVIDMVTGHPVPNVAVSAQGIARDGWYMTRTDQQGRYKLKMIADHYNIWAEVDDRMPLAVKALKAESGVTTGGADIRMMRGGWIVGKLVNSDGQPPPMSGSLKLYVAHQGPARPRTGAGGTSALIQDYATYRLHVAPGRNYVYLMSGNGSAWITVGDGEEVEHDFVIGNHQERPPAFGPYDEDQELAHRLQGQARREDEAEREAQQAFE